MHIPSGYFILPQYILPSDVYVRIGHSSPYNFIERCVVRGKEIRDIRAYTPSSISISENGKVWREIFPVKNLEDVAEDFEL